MNIPKPSFDSPMAQKQQNTKASKTPIRRSMMPRGIVTMI